MPVPQGARDCHLHVFRPRLRYPDAAERSYTPPDASIAQYRKVKRRLLVDNPARLYGFAAPDRPDQFSP